MRRAVEGKGSADPIVVLEWACERYGWTPDEARAISYDDVRAFVDIAGMKARVAEAKAKAKP